MALTVGTHMRTPTSTCEVIDVRGTEQEGLLTCCGGEMSADADAAATPDGSAPQIAMGKRYHDDDTGIELLVVKPGAGPLEFSGRELGLRTAKALPASD